MYHPVSISICSVLHWNLNKTNRDLSYVCPRTLEDETGMQVPVRYGESQNELMRSSSSRSTTEKSRNA